MLLFRVTAVAVIAFAMVASVSGAAYVGPRVVWTFQAPARFLEIGAGNMDSDALDEVAIGSFEGDVFALDHTGKLMWSARPAAYSEYIGVGDLNGDGFAEVVAGSMFAEIPHRFAVTAYSSHGVVEWQYTATNEDLTSVVVTDLNRDGSAEVLATTMGYVLLGTWGTVRLISGDGSEAWSFSLSGPPTIGEYSGIWHAFPAELDGDANIEVAFAGDDLVVYALDSDGTLLWSTPIDTVHGADYTCWRNTAGDIDGDGLDEVIIGTDAGGIWAYDSDGDFLWNARFPLDPDNKVLTADLQGDGRAEVVSGTQEDLVIALDSFGRTLWSQNMPTSTESIAVGDADGDRMPEVAVTPDAFNDYVMLLDGSTGALLWRFATNGWPYTVEFAMVRTDRHASLISGTFGGIVYALQTMPPSVGAHSNP